MDGVRGGSSARRRRHGGTEVFLRKNQLSPFLRSPCLRVDRPRALRYLRHLLALPRRVRTPAALAAVPLVAGAAAGILLADQSRRLAAALRGRRGGAVAARRPRLPRGRGRRRAWCSRVGDRLRCSAGVSLGAAAARARVSPAAARVVRRAEPRRSRRAGRCSKVCCARTPSLTPFGASITLDVTCVVVVARAGRGRPTRSAASASRQACGSSIAGGVAWRGRASADWRAGRTVRVPALLRRPTSYRQSRASGRDAGAGAARHRARRLGQERGARGRRRARERASEEAAAAARAWARRQLARYVGRWSAQSGAHRGGDPDRRSHRACRTRTNAGCRRPARITSSRSPAATSRSSRCCCSSAMRARRAAAPRRGGRRRSRSCCSTASWPAARASVTGPSRRRCVYLAAAHARSPRAAAERAGGRGGPRASRSRRWRRSTPGSSSRSARRSASSSARRACAGIGLEPSRARRRSRRLARARPRRLPRRSSSRRCAPSSRWRRSARRSSRGSRLRDCC